MLVTILGAICSVYQTVISRGEVVALAYVAVVIGCLVDGHMRLLELLADLGWPLGALSAVGWY